MSAAPREMRRDHRAPRGGARVRAVRSAAGVALAVAIGALALLGGPAAAAAQDLAVVGGEVRPVSGPAMADGVVLVRDGRIAAVGPRGSVDVPAGIDVLDASGLVVTPGLLDARTSVALGRGAAFDRSGLIRPDAAARMAERLESLEVPGEFGMEARQTRAHPWVMDGVTSVYVAPGVANLVAGVGAVVKLEGDRLGAVVDSAAALHVVLGDAPDRFFDAPTTRQGRVALLRQWFAAARSAGPGGTFGLGTPASQVEGLAAGTWTVGPDLAAALQGRMPVRFHAHTPDDVLTALRLAEELGLDAVVEGASGAHLVAERIAAAGAGVVLGPAMWGGGGSPEMFAFTAEDAALLHAAGVVVALSTDGSGGRAVTVEAVARRGHGLPADAALRAVTLDAARLLGVDARVGSLEPGKDADLVLWSGDPMGTWGEARTVVVDGRVVFRR